MMDDERGGERGGGAAGRRRQQPDDAADGTSDACSEVSDFGAPSISEISNGLTRRGKKPIRIVLNWQQQSPRKEVKNVDKRSKLSQRYVKEFCGGDEALALLRLQQFREAEYLTQMKASNGHQTANEVLQKLLKDVPQQVARAFFGIGGHRWTNAISGLPPKPRGGNHNQNSVTAAQIAQLARLVDPNNPQALPTEPGFVCTHGRLHRVATTATCWRDAHAFYLQFEPDVTHRKMPYNTFFQYMKRAQPFLYFRHRGRPHGECTVCAGLTDDGPAAAAAAVAAAAGAAAGGPGAAVGGGGRSSSGGGSSSSSSSGGVGAAGGNGVGPASASASLPAAGSGAGKRRRGVDAVHGRRYEDDDDGDYVEDDDDNDRPPWQRQRTGGGGGGGGGAFFGHIGSVIV